jgi:nucleolar protein 56
MDVEIITRWYGTFAVEAGRIIESRPFPSDPAALKERWQLRREGRLAPEESALVEALRASGKANLTSRDRRLHALGVAPAFGHLPDTSPALAHLTGSVGRQLLLEQGRKDLELSWDPSVHLEEAVRALDDLDETMNLLGERLSSWWGRERPEESAEAESAKAVAEALRLGAGSASPEDKAAPGPALAKGRVALAEVWERAAAARKDLEAAIEAEAPVRFPNLNALLGPLLTAKLLSQAGGLARLARLPASTVQVLGAERAFFEHLRGHGPPPRHGLLFLHPAVHGAPRGQRGKIARALAGKVAIAARLDLEGDPTRSALKESFERRLADIRKLGPGHRREGTPRGGADRPARSPARGDARPPRRGPTAT